MPESKNNFVVDGLSGTFAGIGTFHRRGGKTFLQENPCQTHCAGFRKTVSG